MNYKFTSGIGTFTAPNIFEISTPVTRIDFLDKRNINNKMHVGMVAETYGIFSKAPAKLESGDSVYQAGLKIFNINGCNTVYVMRRFMRNPDTSDYVFIAIKNNPGMTKFEECRAGGYKTLAKLNVEKIEHFHYINNNEVPGVFTMSAHVDYNTLHVFYNNRRIWVGQVPEKYPKEGMGLVGFRSDNLKVKFKLI